MEPSQWDNRVFAFCGDLVGGAITTVEVDPEIFDATQDGEIRVATDAFMEEMFDADEGVKMVRPFDNDSDRTELVRARNTIYVTPLYAKNTCY